MVIKPCGSHSFPREEEEEDDQQYPADPRLMHSAGSSPQRSSISSSPSKCRRVLSKCRSAITTGSSSKNPYSSRGLDKFTALLTEIEEKRRSIYSQFNPDEISLVRFDYSNDSNGKPIVVKVKPRPSGDQRIHPHDDGTRNCIIKPAITSTAPADHNKRYGGLKLMKRSQSEVGPVRKVDGEDRNDDDAKKITMSNVSCKLEARKLVQELKKPSYYFVATFVVVLILLALFGRSAAIICTSIGWYLIPSDTGGVVNNSQISRRSFNKKKTLSFNSTQSDGKRKLSSPPGSFNGLIHS